LSAINAGVKELREVIEKAQEGQVLFVDEIHCFSKSQQDALLGAVEQGVITLIGATTENPSFEVNGALLSRSQVYILEGLDNSTLLALAERALKRDEIIGPLNISLEETEALLDFANGDARRMLGLLEQAAHLAASRQSGITNEIVTLVAQQPSIRYDKGGESHYDIASAMIKSIRGSDPHAALYWMARMLVGGEEVRFVARRLVISAAEDIGLANPNALLIATAGFQAVELIGMPEARIILGEVCIYLATSPKSNSAYMAINEAMALAEKSSRLEVPKWLRNAPTKLMKQEGYGKGYKYAHSFPGHFVNQQYMPDALVGKAVYSPADNPRENEIRAQLERWWGTKSE
jgi:putative ATPase